MRPEKINWHKLIARLEADLRARDGKAAEHDRDDAAWKTLTAYLGTIGRAALRKRYTVLSESDISDILQNVLVKLQSLDTLRKIKLAGSPLGYLFVMLNNETIDYIRSRRNAGSFAAEYQDGLADNYKLLQTIEYDRQARSELFRKIKLSAEDLELIKMKFIDDCTIAEMAARKKTTYSAMAVRLHRLMSRIKNSIRR
jgi:RNA polymerase sigma factor (sigma-70 family)